MIQFVKKALAVLEEQMSYDSVMAFLRNPYVVSDENTFDGDILCEDLDRLDNYLLAGGIERINRWKHPWVMPYDNADEEDLSRLNQLREQIFNWFLPLRTVWEKTDTTVREAMTALFSFMQQFDIAYKLKAQPFPPPGQCPPWAKSQGVRVVLPYGNLHPQVWPLDFWPRSP